MALHPFGFQTSNLGISLYSPLPQPHLSELESASTITSIRYSQWDWHCRSLIRFCYFYGSVKKPKWTSSAPYLIHHQFFLQNAAKRGKKKHLDFENTNDFSSFGVKFKILSSLHEALHDVDSASSLASHPPPPAIPNLLFLQRFMVFGILCLYGCSSICLEHPPFIPVPGS